jgi:hypothetical protein
MEGPPARDPVRGPVAAELSRRDFMARVSGLGVGALVLSALPALELLEHPAGAQAAVVPSDATLQAFADTIIPGRKVTKTDMGNEVDSLAIAGVDAEPGAVEADALALYHHPLIGFDALEGPFLADLNTRALAQGGPFLTLSYAKRVQAVIGGLDFSNPARALYEAAAAVPFTAFCAAALHPIGTSRRNAPGYSSGYAVMGYPGAAPNGYADFSYRRKLSRERTKKGYLP